MRGEREEIGEKDKTDGGGRGGKGEGGGEEGEGGEGMEREGMHLTDFWTERKVELFTGLGDDVKLAYIFVA
jgi:hypothetical protein